MDSPFISKDAAPPRCKILIYGDSATGKTTLALRIGASVRIGAKAAVIDLERSTEQYRKNPEFDFQFLQVTDLDSIREAIDWLSKNEHDFTSLIIDPMTLLWEEMRRVWTRRFLKHRSKGRAGHKHDFYDLQPSDWQHIKGDLKEFINSLMRLDMNVIILAREKPKYKEGDFMEKEGTQPDCDRSIRYEFDTVLNLSKVERKNGEAEYFCEVEKDRSLQPRFDRRFLVDNDFSLPPKPIMDVFGESLVRIAQPVELASEEQLSVIRECMAELKFTADKERSVLDHYGVKSWEDLLLDDAVVVVKHFEKRVREAATA